MLLEGNGNLSLRATLDIFVEHYQFMWFFSLLPRTTSYLAAY
jgi:hypothetical protein